MHVYPYVSRYFFYLFWVFFLSNLGDCWECAGQDYGWSILGYVIGTVILFIVAILISMFQILMCSTVLKSCWCVFSIKITLFSRNFKSKHNYGTTMNSFVNKILIQLSTLCISD
jgi:hypothetical protein